MNRRLILEPGDAGGTTVTVPSFELSVGFGTVPMEQAEAAAPWK
jgi:hypothetical protein